MRCPWIGYSIFLKVNVISAWYIYVYIRLRISVYIYRHRAIEYANDDFRIIFFIIFIDFKIDIYIGYLCGIGIEYSS